MGDKTNIEWCDATWNCVTGCSKVSPGCAHCYAETVAARFWPTQYPPVPYVTCSNAAGYTHADGACQPITETRPREFTDVMCHDDRLGQPLRWKRPRRIFVNSMSDLFHEDVPFEFVAAVFAVMAYCSWHTFQVLTKRAKRMRAFMEWVNAPDGGYTFTEEYGPKAGQQITKRRFARVDDDIAMRFLDRTDEGIDLHACLHNGGVWPPLNVWLGVSVENQRFADERIPLLLQTPAAVRFLSCEPLLGPINLRYWLCDGYQDGAHAPGLDWVIVGGESGGGARPFKADWARSIVAQCRAAGIRCFVKQLGKHPQSDASTVWPSGRITPYPYLYDIQKDSHGSNPAEWPEDLRIREFPIASIC